MKTKVLFYLETSPNGSLTPLAVFPEIKERDNAVMCYAHVGQHSAACDSYIEDECTVCTSIDQYIDLKNELINFFGYELNVLNECEQPQ